MEVGGIKKGRTVMNGRIVGISAKKHVEFLIKECDFATGVILNDPI